MMQKQMRQSLNATAHQPPPMLNTFVEIPITLPHHSADPLGQSNEAAYEYVVSTTCTRCDGKVANFLLLSQLRR